MRAVVYCRQSTDKQSSNSEQEQRCLQFCKGMEYDVVAVIRDVKSGRDPNREGFQRVLQMARKREFDILVTVAIDRIMRSLSNLCEVLDEFHRYKIQIHALNTGTLDMDSSSGRLLIGVLGSVSEWERCVLSERTKQGLATRAARGIKGGRPTVTASTGITREIVVKLHEVKEMPYTEIAK